MEKVFFDENMPPGVIATLRTLKEPKQHQCEAAKDAAEAQDKLGPSAILRSCHHVTWVTATMNTYTRRTYPSGTPK